MNREQFTSLKQVRITTTACMYFWKSITAGCVFLNVVNYFRNLILFNTIKVSFTVPVENSYKTKIR